MNMTLCVRCGAQVPAAKALFSAQGLICEDCHHGKAVADLEARGAKTPALAGVALGAAILPFAFSVWYQSGSLRLDFIALAGGALGIGLGLVAAIGGRREALKLTLGIIAAVLGALQLVRGFGLLG